MSFSILRAASRLHHSRANRANRPGRAAKASSHNSHYSHSYYYTYDSSYAAANQIHSSARYPRSQLVHGLARPTTQTTHHPRLLVSQRRVFQTAPPIPATSWCLYHPSLQSRSSLASADLPQPSALLPFSTLSSSSNSSSSSSTSPSVLSPPFSRKHSRRRLALWLPAIMAASQARSHSDDSHSHSHDSLKPHAHGHSHSHGILGHHHHHHDNVYLTSQNKNDAGVRITRIGLLCNLGMAFAKGTGGYVFNSQSMVADAWHSLSDLASDILTLATVSWSLRPPTDKFPTGFGKVESLGSLGVSGMLLGGGVFMCMSSMQSLHAHFFLDAAAAAEVLAHSHGHGHSHSHSHDAPSLHAAWLALGTILIKEWMYRATMKVARERKSSVLASNAVHHRVDSLTGIVTLVAILGANLIRDASWLDPVGGLLISLMVIRAGIENTASALYELADRSIDDEVKGSVRKHVTRALADDVSVPGGQQHQVELRDISGVKSGQNYMVDLELAVPQDWTVETVRTIEDAVRKHVGSAVRGVRRVRVRFVALDETVEKFDEFIPGDVSPRSNPEPEDEDDHSHEDDDKKHKH